MMFGFDGATAMAPIEPLGCVVEDRIPGAAVVVGLPHAAVDRADVEHVRLVGNSDGGLGAAAAERADHAPSQLGVHRGIDLLRLRRGGREREHGKERERAAIGVTVGCGSERLQVYTFQASAAMPDALPSRGRQRAPAESGELESREPEARFVLVLTQGSPLAAQCFPLGLTFHIAIAARRVRRACMAQLAFVGVRRHVTA